MSTRFSLLLASSLDHALVPLSGEANVDERANGFCRCPDIVVGVVCEPASDFLVFSWAIYILPMAVSVAISRLTRK